MIKPHFDPVRRRLHIRYTGFWSEADALDAVERFRQTLIFHSDPRLRAITLLDDLREWPVQSQAVLEITRAFPVAVRQSNVTRNAMIIPRPLLRLQVSRTLHDLPNCSVFCTFEDADEWLKEVE